MRRLGVNYQQLIFKLKLKEDEIRDLEVKVESLKRREKRLRQREEIRLGSDDMQRKHMERLYQKVKIVFQLWARDSVSNSVRQSIGQ